MPLLMRMIFFIFMQCTSHTRINNGELLYMCVSKLTQREKVATSKFTLVRKNRYVLQKYNCVKYVEQAFQI